LLLKHMKSWLLGTDIRVSPDEVAKLWPSARWHTHLLVNNVVPLSVDVSVWPRASEYDAMDDGSSISEVGLLSTKLSTIYRKHDTSSVLIAVVQHGDVEPVNRQQYEYVGHDDQRRLIISDHVFEFVGYDIADFWMGCSLSNCGIGQWVRTNNINVEQALGRVNKWHLLEDIQSATMSRAVFDSISREHSPFIIYSVWREMSDG